jgi:hypothetical protein
VTGNGAASTRVDLALCLIACDRPHYFRQVVRSVRSQADLGDVRVYCFLDGSVNRVSGACRASPRGIARCAEIFTRAFPNGELHASPVNLGIALNFARAERYVFVKRRHNFVLFLEDDFVLQPHYLRVIRAMIREFGDHPRVGAFSAFGDHSASLADQRAHRHAIKPMGHDWAFCLPRARWEERQPYYAPYLQYIRRVDYVLRSNVWITQRLYPRLGAGSFVSSQDAAKVIAMLKAGQVKLSTYTNNGHYIGKLGVHTTPRIFGGMGYRERESLVFTEPVDHLEWTTADLDRIESELRAWFVVPR